MDNDNTVTFLLAQINPTVGDVRGNAAIIIDIIKSNQASHDVIAFPELAVIGYPAQDLLFRTEFHAEVMTMVQAITEVVKDCHVIISYPAIINGCCYNVASVIHEGQVFKTYRKQCLPNYGVFDEERYFTPGEPKPCYFTVKKHTLGICICEDLWTCEPTDQLRAHGVDTLITLNASPFDITKPASRDRIAKERAITHMNMLYINMVGGQDDLVFDGQSFAMDKTGKLCAKAPAFAEALLTVKLTKAGNLAGELTPPLSDEAQLYQALVAALRDYVTKNNFNRVLLGLSGGIDSALVLTIAVDALGPDRVETFFMPSQHTADISAEDSETLAKVLGVNYTTFPIKPTYDTLLKTISPTVKNVKKIVHENLQARIRGVLLMAMANQHDALLLSTSNKSESAVGYATLYGDMCGAFAVLKDVYKTTVYDLARYRNSVKPVIPERILTRPPTAELSPNQTDQDLLPDYETLDTLLKHYVDEGLSPQQLLQLGFNATLVEQVLGMIKRSEYKRHQGPPGPKITRQAFNSDWRYPITSRFKAPLS